MNVEKYVWYVGRIQEIFHEIHRFNDNANNANQDYKPRK